MKTLIHLTLSNLFMTIARYGCLQFRHTALWKGILISGMIAFVEYYFQVPDNRIGSYPFLTAQLKMMQEVITRVVF